MFERGDFGLAGAFIFCIAGMAAEGGVFSLRIGLGTRRSQCRATFRREISTGTTAFSIRSPVVMRFVGVLTEQHFTRALCNRGVMQQKAVKVKEVHREAEEERCRVD